MELWEQWFDEIEIDDYTFIKRKAISKEKDEFPWIDSGRLASRHSFGYCRIVLWVLVGIMECLQLLCNLREYRWYRPN